MLTRDHVIAEYDFRAGKIHPDRLARQTHGQYALYAERMLQIYRDGIGSSRRDLHRAVQQLFADIIDFQRLVQFEGYERPTDLLARYNVAQVQGVLYDAQHLTVWASEDFKTILRYAKLAQLMHTITRLDDGQYRVRLDGPASLMRQTRRYGVKLAQFLPALIACRGWRMQALIRTPRSGWTLALELSAADGLHSHLPAPAEFDSQIEENLARKWGDESREGWRLIREGEILFRDQKTFVPDFVLQHEDGRRVPLEIVGFWTPQYLQTKLQTLEAFRDQHVLLAVAEATGLDVPKLPANAFVYKSVVRIKDLLECLA